MCWDALDGSTIYQLLDANSGISLSTETSNAARALMVIWYLSVGVRMCLMFLVHLPPSSRGYHLVCEQPQSFSSQPTVDRTLQALSMRAEVIILMVFAEVYAAVLRIYLWHEDKLDSIQQKMTIKNLLFIAAMYSAYSLWSTAKNRDWNSRELGFGLRMPSRYSFCMVER